MAKSRVLVVDDDKDLVANLRQALEKLDFHVSVAYDAVQAVAKAEESHPDVILLDFAMPAGGGATAYERLRNSTDTSNIPVVFTTGAKLEEVQGRIRPGPQTFFLKKPVSVTQLEAMLEKVLKPRPEPSPAAKKKPRQHEFEVRVTYADTDKMGVIYYANYFKYFELGRTEFMRSLGIRYRDLETDRKLFLPIVEAHCEYLGASRYDDLLVVRTWLAWLRPASLLFRYDIHDRGSADRLVARGSTRHAVLNELWRPARIPTDLKEILAPFVEE